MRVYLNLWYNMRTNFMQKSQSINSPKQSPIASIRVLPLVGFIFCLVVFGFSSISIAIAAGYQKIAPGDAVTLGEFVFEDDFTPTTMNANADGWHYYDYTTSVSAEHGIWPSIMSCGSAVNGDLVKADKSFIVATSTISAQDVWDVDIADLTTAGSIGKAFADNRTVEFLGSGEILAGSGTNNYRAKLYLYDLSSQPVNAITAPTITIKNASGGTFETGTMDDYAGDENGIYEYITTIGSGQGAGRWEAIASVD